MLIECKQKNNIFHNWTAAETAAPPRTIIAACFCFCFFFLSFYSISIGCLFCYDACDLLVLYQLAIYRFIHEPRD